MQDTQVRQIFSSKQNKFSELEECISHYGTDAEETFDTYFEFDLKLFLESFKCFTEPDTIENSQNVNLFIFFVSESNVTNIDYQFEEILPTRNTVMIFVYLTDKPIDVVKKVILQFIINKSSINICECFPRLAVI